MGRGSFYSSYFFQEETSTNLENKFALDTARQALFEYSDSDESSQEEVKDDEDVDSSSEEDMSSDGEMKSGMEEKREDTIVLYFPFPYKYYCICEKVI